MIFDGISTYSLVLGLEDAYVKCERGGEGVSGSLFR
jgi:hypothetical protein